MGTVLSRTESAVRRYTEQKVLAYLEGEIGVMFDLIRAVFSPFLGGNPAPVVMPDPLWNITYPRMGAINHREGEALRNALDSPDWNRMMRQARWENGPVTKPVQILDQWLKYRDQVAWEQIGDRYENPWQKENSL